MNAYCRYEFMFSDNALIESDTREFLEKQKVF